MAHTGWRSFVFRLFGIRHLTFRAVLFLFECVNVRWFYFHVVRCVVTTPLHRKLSSVLAAVFLNQGTANATASTPHFWGELDDVFSTLSSAGGAVGAAFTSSPEMDSIARAAMTAAKAASAPVVSVLQLLLELDVSLDYSSRLLTSMQRGSRTKGWAIRFSEQGLWEGGASIRSAVLGKSTVCLLRHGDKNRF